MGMRGRVLTWSRWLALGTWLALLVGGIVEVAISEPYRPDGRPLTLQEELLEPAFHLAITCIFPIGAWLVSRRPASRLALVAAVVGGFVVMASTLWGIVFLPVVVLWLGATFAKRTHSEASDP